MKNPEETTRQILFKSPNSICCKISISVQDAADKYPKSNSVLFQKQLIKTLNHGRKAYQQYFQPLDGLSVCNLYLQTELELFEQVKK